MSEFEKWLEINVKENIDHDSYWRGGQKQYYENGARAAYEWTNKVVQKQLEEKNQTIKLLQERVKNLREALEFISEGIGDRKNDPDAASQALAKDKELGASN